MKKIIVTTMLALALMSLARAQKYSMTFIVSKAESTKTDMDFHPMLYIGQHYRDGFTILDSAKVETGNEGTYRFNGKKKWETGIYSLVSKHDNKGLIDFTIDGSQNFTMRLTSDFAVADPGRDISGSAANVAMQTYNNRINDAMRRVRDIEQRKKSKSAKEKEEAENDMEMLTKEMTEFESTFVKQNEKYRFFQLVKMFDGPKVPDEVEDKAVYYRTHYWDGVDFADHGLVRTPDLYKKMNYYFFGVLYHADKDTICRYADMVLHKIEDDTLMLRYFMDFIMPKYYRSTKNVGWDATWCHLVRQYYLSGKCSWATQSDLANKRQTVEFLEKSLIGAIGAELWMADTNQSENPNDWISSHRFPQKYVILWFWDPDCHHCQEQTASLKTLYDSLSAAGSRPFEVYAIGYEADVSKWKRYVREHQLPFVNVGGSNVNIDYQEAYNVHGAPTMIILNEERRIIMNKVIPTSSILPFLKQYEELRSQGKAQ